MAAKIGAGVGNAYDAHCPTRLVLDQLADKWAVLILGAVTDQPVRFNELKRRIEGISQKMLGQTLKKLERNGLVERQAFATVPVTVTYSITPLGRTLAASVNSLRCWAELNIHEVVRSQQAFDANTQVMMQN